MDWITDHWLSLLVVTGVAGFVVRVVLKSRSRKRQLEEWAAERRRQREREDREEAERRQRAQELAAAKMCRTEDELSRALGNRLEEITIEGRLANLYAAGSSALQSLGAEYKIVLARHGKVVLKRG